MDNYEVGFKARFGNSRLNGAFFYNEISDMQREVNLADPVAGVVQVIKNTADAEILGIELDGTFALPHNFVLIGSLGYLDAEYDKVSFDLNGDGRLDGADKKLDLPRAAELTYSIGVVHDHEIEWGNLISRLTFSHRDESPFTDNNLGFITEQDILDAGIDFHSNDGKWTLGIYGKNLLDEVKHGGDTQLPRLLGPLPLGGTFSPLAKGRVIGFDITRRF